MRLYAEMLEECKKDLANVIELIEIEKKRGKQKITRNSLLSMKSVCFFLLRRGRS